MDKSMPPNDGSTGEIHLCLPMHTGRFHTDADNLSVAGLTPTRTLSQSNEKRTKKSTGNR